MQSGSQNDSKLPKDLTISDFVIDFNFNQQDNMNPGKERERERNILNKET